MIFKCKLSPRENNDLRSALVHGGFSRKEMLRELQTSTREHGSDNQLQKILT